MRSNRGLLSLTPSKLTQCLCAIGTIAGLLVACAHKPVPRQSVSAAKVARVAETTGTASMLKDGRIVLRLHHMVDGKKVATLQIFKPGDMMYEQTLSRVGGLELGQTKPVPPWPDDGAGIGH